MEEIYFIICGKYRKFEDPLMSYIFEKTLVLSIIYGKCGSEDEKLFQEQETFEILTILSLIKNM